MATLMTPKDPATHFLYLMSGLLQGDEARALIDIGSIEVSALKTYKKVTKDISLQDRR